MSSLAPALYRCLACRARPPTTLACRTGPTIPLACRTRPAATLLRRSAHSASSYGYWDPGQFQPRKAVVLTKVSRYEFEKQRHEHLSEKELEDELTARGSNYATVRYHHNIHKTLELEVVRELEAAGLETRTVKRCEYNDEAVAWADMVVTTGGDGTFLMGSSKILNRSKPVIGINTDPTRSEGHLCLPKHFSFNVKEAVDAIMNGHFRWFFR